MANTAFCINCKRSGRYTYKGTSTRMCFPCFKEWRLNAKCPVCKESAIGNVVETEDDLDNLYYWHFECWQLAMEQAQQTMLEASRMRNKAPEIVVSTL